MTSSRQIVSAVNLAAFAHMGQKRDGLDEPFIMHPIRVAREAMSADLSDEAIVAAYLHDVIEDTSLTMKDLKFAGFSERSLDLVDRLTKTWDLKEAKGTLSGEAFRDLVLKVKTELKPAYYARIAEDPEAVALKLLDRTDNLLDTVRVLPANRVWATRYLTKTREEISPLAADNAILPYITDRFHHALWMLEKALTVASMAEAIRPLAETKLQD